MNQDEGALLALDGCRMCFGTGRTARYRGPSRHGPCINCKGAAIAKTLSPQSDATSKGGVK